MKISFLRTGPTLICVLLVMSVSFGVTITSVGAESSTTKLYISPPKIGCWTPAFGETFKVNASIANVSLLHSFEFKLYWNTTLLDLVEAEIQPFLNWPWLVYIYETNETLGRFWLNETTVRPYPPKSGSGPLVTLTFNITYEPIWPENITCALDLAETRLAESDWDLIPHDVYDGEYWCYSSPRLILTTMTDKSIYDPNEPIQVYGNLSLGYSPVQDGLVALEIDNPLNAIVVVRTLSTGIPPANQTIEIIDVTPCDQWGDPKTSFYKGTMAYFKVTVKNNDNKTRRVLITINLYDAENKPFGWNAFEGPVAAGSTASVIRSFPIPDTASVGYAQVYASALNKWPKDGGIAFCPEESATFEIKEIGGAGAMTSLLQNLGSSPEGTYNLTFVLGPDERAGNYIVYVASDYTMDGYYQKATNNVTFGFRISAPTAEFTWTPFKQEPNETITFDASTSLPGWNGTHYTPIVRYEWNFGDGNITIIGDDEAATPTITHVYTTIGNYTVSLNVTDTQELWSFTSHIVEIKVKPDWPWDLNGDGKVTITDIVIVALAFGSVPGDPNWNPDCDLDGSGKVTITDIVIVAMHFGEEW